MYPHNVFVLLYHLVASTLFKRNDKGKRIYQHICQYFISFILLLFNYFTSIPLPVNLFVNYTMAHTFLESFLVNGAKQFLV
jgi:hypothetical protein